MEKAHKPVVSSGTQATWTTERMVGKNWGLNPKIAKWVYTAIVRPTITLCFGNLVEIGDEENVHGQNQ